ncbi:Chloroplastic group IIA intron splicing facilitator CRS1, chloroplastic [Apostasia shenzhenica]|uniref:Chloroplastic group IIA intron splicing facilitator CRS1, chloroplastic n=1 Tax=Apostasia shenzhenica TaxID=1088818 RepID=A0A2I0BEG6_9ASPA|nr:Chloroplastic group IIA intron splicing facilitator CRS1, chloroplastic [Apostasia shenzhenica]
MASISFTLQNLPLFSSTFFSSSYFPLIPQNRIRYAYHSVFLVSNAHVSSHTLQPIPEDENLAAQSCSEDIKKNKNKKNQLRPSFYDQTVQKWSIKKYSQRLAFPWQEQSTEGKTSDYHHRTTSGMPFAPHNHRTSAFTESSMKPRSMQLDEEDYSSKPLKNSKPFRVKGPSDSKFKKLERFSNSENSSYNESHDDSILMNSLFDDGKPINSTLLPWERQDTVGNVEAYQKRGNTELAERTIPEPELRRLRNDALRMKERMKIGPAGVTGAVVKSIHQKWNEAEVVKLQVEGQPSFHMNKIHEILERKTGGIVIWRSGKSLVLYQGLTYKLPCARSCSNVSDTIFGINISKCSNDSGSFVGTEDCSVRASEPSDADNKSSSPDMFGVSREVSVINDLLNQLGPRYKDWSGREPLPVDADLLPAVVPCYKPPFRLLPYKTRRSLTDNQMTYLRRIARSMAPHFALGRNKYHQGLADAIVKLWEKSAIAKIAIKRGVQNTSNERMAEEIKELTGGTLLSRNCEFIVFYRGNDFLTPSLRNTLVEREKLATVQQDAEEDARSKASYLTNSYSKAVTGPLVAGTLTETLEAYNHWTYQPNSEEREKMRTDLALSKHASLVRYLERKLSYAIAKVRKAEKALAKLQESLQPAKIPTDLETVTDEERSLFRQLGLKMRAYLPVGRRDVFDGTIQNIHLNWKHRELAKIIVKGKSFAQVKHIAISLEAETGGVLISVDKTTKGYAIIIYRGKNYQRPLILRPKNLLSKREALERSIELQRREALNHHISNLHEQIQMLKSELVLLFFLVFIS